MTILVTGAGLIASHIARAVQERNVEIVLYDLTPSHEYLGTVLDVDRARIYSGDITNLPELAHIAQQHRVTSIVHTAALIGARVSREPYRGVEINVGGSIAVIEAARLAGVKRVVFCSSVAVYALDRLPENASITEESPLGPKNLYGATKLASELLLSQYGEIYGIEVIHLRLAGVFGRGQYIGGSWMGRKLNQALRAILQGEEALIKPEWIGTQEYLYVKDAAQAFAIACLKDIVPARIYNIGTGVVHSYADVIDEIRRALPHAKIHLHTTGEQIASYLDRTQAFDISKAKAQLGFAPRFTFQDGLRDYLAELSKFSESYYQAA